nr:2OG-Fe(II) oxygenase [Bacillus pseudomycoides]
MHTLKDKIRYSRYLNNVSSSGETSFPLLNIKVAPSEGVLLVFENYKKDSNERHLFSKHEGCLVHDGEKWIATLWFHERNQYWLLHSRIRRGYKL